MRKTFVRSFDGENGVPALEAVAFVQHVIGERSTITTAQLEQRDGFIDAAEPPFVPSGELHRRDRRAPIVAHDLAGANELRIAIEALLDLLDRQVECGRVETLASSRGH